MATAVSLTTVIAVMASPEPIDGRIKLPVATASLTRQIAPFTRVAPACAAATLDAGSVIGALPWRAPSVRIALLVVDMGFPFNRQRAAQPREKPRRKFGRGNGLTQPKRRLRWGGPSSRAQLRRWAPRCKSRHLAGCIPGRP